MAQSAFVRQSEKIEKSGRCDIINGKIRIIIKIIFWSSVIYFISFISRFLAKFLTLLNPRNSRCSEYFSVKCNLTYLDSSICNINLNRFFLFGNWQISYSNFLNLAKWCKNLANKCNFLNWTKKNSIIFRERHWKICWTWRKNFAKLIRKNIILQT